MEGVEYPIMEPKSDGDYVVFKKGDKKKEVLRFRLNEEGKATFALVRGEYDLFRADKLMDLKSFIAENKYDNQFIKFSDDDCFQTWKNQVDLTFQVNGEKVQLINKIRCYVGDNPCAKYIGPPAP